ncbi:MAG TPA: hypothetical protein VFE78_00350 [Gemmataceae bacterium]|jgi:hypothetical protein|nr:hypothetical protein [Gemmataceae bacterium]
MRYVRAMLAAALVLAAGVAWAADAPALKVETADGTVAKVGKDTLEVRTRGADGRFGKAVTFKVTGTTKLTTVTAQKRAGKEVATQKDTDLKDLQPNQPIALIYTKVGASPVLLAAVAQPAPAK